MTIFGKITFVKKQLFVVTQLSPLQNTSFC